MQKELIKLKREAVENGVPRELKGKTKKKVCSKGSPTTEQVAV